MPKGTGHNQVLAARRRALWALALFVCGTIIGAHVVRAQIEHGAVVALGISALCVAVSVFVPTRWRAGLLGAAVMLLGVGWCALRVDPHRPDRLSARVGELDVQLGAVPIEVRGVVTRSSRVIDRVPGLADPPMWPDRTNAGELRVRSVLIHTGDGRTDWVDTGGSLRVLLPMNAAVSAGSRIELLGRYSAPGSRRNPGEPDWDLLAAQRASVGTLVVDDASHIRPIAPGGLLARGESWLLSLRGVIRARALASIGSEDDAAGVRSALLLGEREPSFERVFSSFQRVGVAHLLAISGFHLALVVFMGALLIRAVGDHPRLETAAVLVVLVGVVVLIPMRPPIVRAAVIVAAMLLASGAGRRYDRLTVLAWVGLGLLVWRPLDAMSMGWQLSMGVTALLVSLGDGHRRALLARESVLPTGRNRARGLWARAGFWVWGALKVNLCCWLVALPTVVYHAGVVGTLAPIAAVGVLPIVALLMACGYLQIIIGVLWPELAVRTMWLVEAPSAWAMGMIGWFEQLPLAWVRVPSVSAGWAIGATLVLALLVTGHVRWKRPLGIGALLVVTAWGFAQGWLHKPSAPLRVVMLDVGDGSCLIVQSGSEALVWDCGSLDRRMGEATARALRTMGVRGITDVIVTHDNLDHYNALPDLHEAMGFERVRITARLRDDASSAWTRVQRDLESRGVTIETIRRGDELMIGGASMRVLWPEPTMIAGYDDNDTSVVALLDLLPGRVGHPRMLLTGDIEQDAMERLMVLEPGLTGELAGGVLELPHHGSARDAAYGFVGWLDPGVIVQSTGPSRLDDDRWDAQRPGRDWFTTAQGGAIVVEFDASGAVTARYWFGR
ncbi:MAG: ComEC/Rec2 family competence protein [Phycisphaerales bacterium]|nr:ComEC/Rec2 family competence protein [Phycisphaerales bacterium]